jgi:hypothetical protein
MTEAAAELENTRKRLAMLLNAVGVPGSCLGPNCHADVLWVVHINGRRTPYDPDGTNHFITCPDRELFKRRRS